MENAERSKKYFKIGEVAKELEVEPYVLRYWETEFDQLTPHKTRSGQRSYDRNDLELLRAIRWLLYDEMYTIAGARKQLGRMREAGRGYAAVSFPEPAQQSLLLGAEQDKRIQELERECDALRCALNEPDDNILKMLEGLETERDALLQQVEQLSQRSDVTADLLDERNTAQVAIAELELENQALGQEVARLASELDARREENAWLTAESERLQALVRAREQRRASAFSNVRRELERLRQSAE